MKEALETFAEVYINKLKVEDKNLYNSFFETVIKKRDFVEQQIVRVKRGVYKGDLAKIIKVYHNRVKALIVPRVDLKLMTQRMREAENKLKDKALLDQKNAIFKKLTDPKVIYPGNKRPQKQLVTLENLSLYEDLTAVKRLTLSDNGMFLLVFPITDIEKPTGTILPIDLEPFALSGNILK